MNDEAPRDSVLDSSADGILETSSERAAALRQLRVFRISDGVLGFYDGRVAGWRFMEGENWVDSGALALGICSYALLGGCEALIYDTHVSLAHARVIRQTLEHAGVRNIRVVLSHWHLDHIAGNEVFSDCEIIAHRLTHAALESRRESIENGSAEGPPVIEPLVLPSTVYEEQLPLSVGGRRVHLVHANIHSVDGTVLYLPDEGLLFAGDTLEDPVTYVCEPRELDNHLAGLVALERYRINHILPNHGDPEVIAAGGYRPALIKAATHYLSALQRLRDHPDISVPTLREVMAEPFAAGWAHYFEPYEAVHQQNVHRVRSQDF